VSAVRPYVPDRFAYHAHHDRIRGFRDAVIFAWFVPEEMPELGEYYLGLLRYYQPQSKLFIGMNHHSAPVWEERIRDSGLDAEIRWAAPDVDDYWDTTGFLAALASYDDWPESFHLAWFSHTKGGSQPLVVYHHRRYQHLRHLWARRTDIEHAFDDPRYGLWAARHVVGLPGNRSGNLSVLQRIYRDRFLPLGLHPFETVFVMRNSILRSFCDAVGHDFFETNPTEYGGDRWFFEFGFPSIVSMQGYEPFIPTDVPGENDPSEHVSLVNDHKQNHRLALAELRRWHADPLRFSPQEIPWANFPDDYPVPGPAR
jgi:hypothetical protein